MTKIICCSCDSASPNSLYQWFGFSNNNASAYSFYAEPLDQQGTWYIQRITRLPMTKALPDSKKILATITPNSDSEANFKHVREHFPYKENHEHFVILGYNKNPANILHTWQKYQQHRYDSYKTITQSVAFNALSHRSSPSESGNLISTDPCLASGFVSPSSSAPASGSGEVLSST